LPNQSATHTVSFSGSISSKQANKRPATSLSVGCDRVVAIAFVGHVLLCCHFFQNQVGMVLFLIVEMRQILFCKFQFICI
jgi:hypothetical protein